ncbi:MAG: ATP-grasp domain-containing protein [Synergistaceae bacterium]|nr:ATP-grasp domain-containing protein [Synergistaceae bacterium]
MNRDDAKEPPRGRPVILVAAAVEPGARLDVADALEARAWVCDALQKGGWTALNWDITPSLVASPAAIVEHLRKTGALCVFNLFEGFSGDSGAEHRFRAVVEAASVPCTGNTARVLETCLSKERTCLLLRRKGIPVPSGVTLHSAVPLQTLDSLPVPLFLKPLCEDGSVGIDERSLVTDRKALACAAAGKLKNFPGGVRAEEFLPGKEYSVSCLGNGPYFIPSVSVIDYEKQKAGLPYLDWGSKWDPSSPLYSLAPEPAEGPDKERAARLAADAGRALGCSGYFRADIREKAGELYVIDVNPNPDMGAGGGFVRQCREGGLDRNDLALHILGLAMNGRPEGEADELDS